MKIFVVEIQCPTVRPPYTILDEPAATPPQRQVRVGGRRESGQGARGRVWSRAGQLSSRGLRCAGAEAGTAAAQKEACPGTSSSASPATSRSQGRLASHCAAERCTRVAACFHGCVMSDVTGEYATLLLYNSTIFCGKLGAWRELKVLLYVFQLLRRETRWLNYCTP